ncbi:FtsX-like permease family protein [Pararhodospirillum oryzae]|uniref:ABC3 transporter permease C-terminal domain-containing protein n=1 Tax=Pararhodospirillum oryzae TaxID=478448 RepID=A0A512H8E0_9PROT|nr:FtsX-like permease family protein [Pararhodospirillum oryzae]GEO81724.1 hypothetical protein ROR02_18550 [Pararhodospirillum oryzae]
MKPWYSGQAMVLGWRDLRHEPVAALCQVLAVMAVLTPLLLLYGLKTGVITHLLDDLRKDVRTLQVSIVNETNFTTDWIVARRQDPAVGFIQAHTRSLATDVDLVVGQGTEQRLGRATLLASGAGDPLLPDATLPPDLHGIVVSRALASTLKVDTGYEVNLMVSRKWQGGLQAVRLPLTVAGIVPLEKLEGAVALVALDTLVDVERWRDGAAVPERGWMEGEERGPRVPSFPNIRLYAASLEAVAPLVGRLSAEGYEVRSHLGAINGILTLNHGLDLLFVMLGGAAALGGSIAFGATLWANVLRKQGFVALIRLQGMRRRAVMFFPLTQAVALTLGGFGVSVAVAELAQALINRFLGPEFGIGSAVCRILPEHIGVAALLALALAIVASLAAAATIARTDPSQGVIHVV